MQKSNKTALFKKKIFNLNILNNFLSSCLPWKFIYKKEKPKGLLKNGWIQTP